MEGKRSYQEQLRKCGKVKTGHCHVCTERGGHGPYWYAFYRENGKLRSMYLGKLKEGQTLEELDAQRQSQAEKNKRGGKTQPRSKRGQTTGKTSRKRLPEVPTQQNDQAVPKSVTLDLHATITLRSSGLGTDIMGLL